MWCTLWLSFLITDPENKSIHVSVLSESTLVEDFLHRNLSKGSHWSRDYQVGGRDCRVAELGKRSLTKGLSPPSCLWSLLGCWPTLGQATSISP